MQAGINKSIAPASGTPVAQNKMTANTPAKAPVFPKLLSIPLRALPSSTHTRLLAKTLNRVFADDLKQGELDFLEGRVVQVSVSDIGIRYRFSLQQEKFLPAADSAEPDLLLEGTVYDYLLLASRREDTDALFFSRRLHMQGDTELGLFVKNFLDGLDMESHRLPAFMESFIRRVLPFYEKFF